MNTSLATPAICYGEILWDVLPDGAQPGGALLNVAYHLNKLGVGTSLVSRVGRDENGRRLETLIDSWGIKKNLLQYDSQYPTSEVIARMNNGNEVSYEIVFPVAWDFIENDLHIKNQLNAASYFVYGSLASRNGQTRQTLLELLETDSIKVLDINLRPPYINRSLLGELLSKADIVKFNEAELEMVQIQFKGKHNNEASRVAFIQDYFNIPEVVVTRGEFGASYYKGSQVYNVAGRGVKVADTIGAGDAFLAAFITSHYMGEHPVTILKNAIAMGGFIATKKGGCPDYQLSEYHQFKSGIFQS